VRIIVRVCLWCVYVCSLLKLYWLLCLHSTLRCSRSCCALFLKRFR